MESLDFKVKGQKVKFTLPQVNIYGLTVIDLWAYADRYL